MKKSVKKVLAALLSVLLFASLFTTTAFAAGPTQADVADAQKTLNEAIENFYSKVGKAWIGVDTDAVDATWKAKLDGAILANLEKNYPAVAAMIDAGIDPATAIAEIGPALSMIAKGIITANANQAISTLYENQAAAIDKATEAYVANLEAFFENLAK